VSIVATATMRVPDDESTRPCGDDPGYNEPVRKRPSLVKEISKVSVHLACDQNILDSALERVASPSILLDGWPDPTDGLSRDALLEHRTEKWIPLFGLIRCSIPLAGASVDPENRVHLSVRRVSQYVALQRSRRSRPRYKRILQCPRTPLCWSANSSDLIFGRPGDEPGPLLPCALAHIRFWNSGLR
jgi:hypothetical protein